jgi:hypothetical protein
MATGRILRRAREAFSLRQSKNQEATKVKNARTILLVLVVMFGMTLLVACTERSSTPAAPSEAGGADAQPGTPGSPPPPGGEEAPDSAGDFKMKSPLKGDACLKLCGELCPAISKCGYNDYKKAADCLADCKTACDEEKISKKYEACLAQQADCAQLGACMKKADEEDRVAL